MTKKQQETVRRLCRIIGRENVQIALFGPGINLNNRKFVTGRMRKNNPSNITRAEALVIIAASKALMKKIGAGIDAAEKIISTGE